MKPHLAFLVSVTASVVSVEAVHACSYPNPPVFKEVAPTAKYIFSFRVVSLSVDEMQETARDGDERFMSSATGVIQVQENIRGDATPFKTIRFTNEFCGGMDIKLGHRYLVATDQDGPELLLAAHDQSIGDLDHESYQAFNAYKSDEKDPYILAAKSAAAGMTTFDDVLDHKALLAVVVEKPVLVDIPVKKKR